MIIVRLQGGLGNQMFQYALGRVLSLKNNTELVFDTDFLGLSFYGATKRNFELDVFNINISLVNKNNIPILFRTYNKITNRIFSFIIKILKIKGKERGHCFNPSVMSAGGSVYLDGFWQSFKYFKGYEDVIKKDFTLKSKPDQNILDLASEMKNINSLCVHLRRSDYVNNKNHDVVDMDYYVRGIEHIKNKSKIDKIYIFSDDIVWCKENLKFNIPTFFVGDEYVGDRNSGHLFLMSQCRNFIIANSTFSWWGAFLASNPEKIVVYPKVWAKDFLDTSDLIPDNWIRI